MTALAYLHGGCLTSSELVALREMAGGLTHREAAERRVLSPETVKSQRASVRAKLGARTGPHAVALAYQRGLLATEDGEVMPTR